MDEKQHNNSFSSNKIRNISTKSTKGIPQIDTTYVNKANTHNVVFQMANQNDGRRRKHAAIRQCWRGIQKTEKLNQHATR